MVLLNSHTSLLPTAQVALSQRADVRAPPGFGAGADAPPGFSPTANDSARAMAAPPGFSQGLDALRGPPGFSHPRPVPNLAANGEAKARMQP
jgi:hypothetical protein